MFGAKKLDSFCCLPAFPLVDGVARLPALCTLSFGKERSGVALDAEGRLVRSLSAGLDAELDRIHPVGLIELVDEADEGVPWVLVVVAATWPAADCLDTMLLLDS